MRNTVIRKISCLVMALCCLALFMVLSVTASAEGEDQEVRLTAVASPDELIESGTVTLTFSVSNYSEYELNDLQVRQGEEIFTIDQLDAVTIPPNGSVEFSFPWTVPESRIGLETVFTVSYSKYGESYSADVPVVISRGEDPVIEVKRSVSSEFCREGESVTIIYELSNTTKFDMKDITLYDSAVSSSPILRNHSLNAGSSVSQSYVYTMGAKDAVSEPIVTYEVNGVTKTFSAVEPMTISLVDVNISMDVEMGQATAVGVPFTITVANVGNTEVKNISVLDERGNKVNASVFSLLPGSEYAITYTVVPSLSEQVRNVSFSLYGVDAHGEAYENATVLFYPVYPFIEDSQISVTISADAIGEWSLSNGQVPIRVSIVNVSEVNLKNAILTENTQGILAEYETLANGTTVYEGTVTMSTPELLTFLLTAEDPAGTVRQLASVQLQIVAPAATEAPVEETPAPGQTVMPIIQAEPKPVEGGISHVIKVVIIAVGAIVGIALVAVIILTLMEHKSTGGLDIDIHGQDTPDDEELDPFFREEETDFTGDDPTEPPQAVARSKRNSFASHQAQLHKETGGRQPEIKKTAEREKTSSRADGYLDAVKARREKNAAREEPLPGKDTRLPNGQASAVDTTETAVTDTVLMQRPFKTKGTLTESFHLTEAADEIHQEGKPSITATETETQQPSCLSENASVPVRKTEGKKQQECTDGAESLPSGKTVGDNMPQRQTWTVNRYSVPSFVKNAVKDEKLPDSPVSMLDEQKPETDLARTPRTIVEKYLPDVRPGIKEEPRHVGRTTEE